MTGFDRFNIRSLSPTMLAQWDQAPATFILKKVYGIRSKPNANMWRGDAVEAALLFYFRNRKRQDARADAKRLAEQTFWHRADGEVTDEAEQAAKRLPGLVDQVADFADELDKEVMASQLVAEGFIDGINAPFFGKMDFVFTDKTILELKTTTRCPSSLETAKLPHRWQAGTYSTLRQAPTTLLYVTAKKRVHFEIEPEDEKLTGMRLVARSMEKALSTCSDGRELLRSLSPNLESFYWDDDTTNAYVAAVEGTLRPLVGPGTEDLASKGYVTFGKHAGKHISDLPASYLDWLLHPQLSSGDTFEVPEALQDAIHDMRQAA